MRPSVFLDPGGAEIFLIAPDGSGYPAIQRQWVTPIYHEGPNVPGIGWRAYYVLGSESGC